MRDIKITTWAKKHGACDSGIRWALDRCHTGKMSEAWEKLLEHGTEVDPNGYLWWVISKCFDDKTLRLLSVRMVRETPLADGRKVVDLLTDQRSLNALVAAERFANGEISRRELAAASAAARDAASAARDAASAAWGAAWDAASAAWGAARGAARGAASAAWDAARGAASAARDAAWDAASAAWGAARGAASAAWDAARGAARDAWDAARDAASAAARDAARDAQIKIVAELGNPWRTK